MLIQTFHAAAAVAMMCLQRGVFRRLLLDSWQKEEFILPLPVAFPMIPEGHRPIEGIQRLLRHLRAVGTVAQMTFNSL